MTKFKRLRVHLHTPLPVFAYEGSFVLLSFSTWKFVYKPTFGVRITIFNKELEITFDAEKYSV